ncbi:MAG: glycosyltransferase family 2 protein [bacterium]
MPEHPTLSILTVSYQTATEVARLVESLHAHPPSCDWHLVIVDNASPDRSGPSLAAKYADDPTVTVRLSDTNRGFGQANNWAAGMCDSEYLAIVNPDCIVEADSFDGCIAFLKTHPEVGVVGPRFFDPSGEPQAWVRNFPNPWAGLGGRQSFLRRLWPDNPFSRSYLLEDDSDNDGPRLCDWVVGTVMVVRRDEFLAIGGFDPDFFLYWEDCDLCWRYWKLSGLRTAFIPSGRIVHHAEAASRKVKPFAIRHFNRAAYLLVRKHLYPSPWHPLRWFAWFALGLRARIQLWRAR